MDRVQSAKDLLEASGYVVIKRESYRRAQERQRIAEAQRVAAEENAEGTRVWAFKALDEQRRMSDRLESFWEAAAVDGRFPRDFLEQVNSIYCAKRDEWKQMLDQEAERLAKFKGGK